MCLQNQLSELKVIQKARKTHTKENHKKIKLKWQEFAEFTAIYESQNNTKLKFMKSGCHGRWASSLKIFSPFDEQNLLADNCQLTQSNIKEYK